MSGARDLRWEGEGSEVGGGGGVAVGREPPHGSTACYSLCANKREVRRDGT